VSQQGEGRIPWKRLAAESVAIVASILLAFAIDAWWDGQRDRGREEDLMIDLLADFRSSRGELATRLVLARRMATTNALFTEQVDSHRGPGPLAVPDSLVLGVLGGPTYEPSMNALDAAVASGEVVLLTNPRIREELATWRRALVDTAEDEQEVRRLTNQQVIPLLARSLRVAPYMRNVLAWSFGQPVEGLPGEATLTPSPELAGALALRQFFVEFSAADLEGLLGSLDRVEGLLEAELRGRGVDP
jgi:hypothetical protein